MKWEDATSYSQGQRGQSEMPDGGFLISTHCLYPSFEPVSVFVLGYGDGFIVHDNAEAARLAWMYGVDDRSFKRIAYASSNDFDCKIDGVQIQCEAPSAEWLWAAIASVANASSDAARTAVGKVMKKPLCAQKPP